MITEALLNLIYYGYSFFMNRIPDIDLTIPADIVGGFINIITGIGYIFPLGDFLIILTIFILITNFRIIYNTIRTIRSFLPF